MTTTAGAAMDPAEFRNAIGRFLTGVTVITTAHDAVLHGITASAVASLSVDPPTLLVCLNKQSATRGAVAAARRFVVNVLAADQVELAMHFASKSPEKFVRMEVETSPHGLPRLPGAVATIECVVAAEVDGGTHSIFVGRAESGSTGSGAPLGYFRGRFVQVEPEA
jgi:4-nitrophenol 2-monooxygenase / 4-nitrocatechol 4-monooxygenase, reductase component